MALYALVGIPGSGKTYSMTWLGLQAVRSGRPVWSNYRVDPVALRAWLGVRGGREAWGRWELWRAWRDPADLAGVRHGLLLFDEAHLWAFSRRWRELPTELLWWWTQSRKFGVDVYFSAQRLQSVDAALRELVAEVWWAKGRVWRWFRLVRTDPHGADRRVRMGYVWVPWDPLAACVYDTAEVLTPPAWAGLVGQQAPRSGASDWTERDGAGGGQGRSGAQPPEAVRRSLDARPLRPRTGASGGTQG
jgi:hypothetical protein